MTVTDKVARQVYDKYQNACALCYRAVDLQIHHKRHRSEAPPGSAARKEIDSLPNLILLCSVCHDAQHGLYSTAADGFNCDACPVSWVCEFSRAKALEPLIRLVTPKRSSVDIDQIVARQLARYEAAS